MFTLLELFKNINTTKAYFLGALITANECYIQDNIKYWSVPIRHNPGQATPHELKQHYNFLKVLSRKVNGNILTSDILGNKMGFASGKQGFAVLFTSDLKTNLSSILQASQVILTMNSDIKRSFLIGVFDGRSSLDKNSTTDEIRNIAVDCEDKAGHDIISSILSDFGITPLNQNESRERLEGGRPRKNQLRIPKKYVSEFATNIGFISPLRFKAFKNSFSEIIPYIKNEDSLLPGLKSLSYTQTEDTIEENKLDDLVIKSTNIDNINPILHTYSGIAKPKPEPIVSKGRKLYARNPQTAVNALTLASYKCEIDGNHYTFIRKKNNKPYTEPHHLVPMAFSERFDVSLDVEENIVSLCSNCHNFLHYGRDAKELLNILYPKRKNMLANVGIDIDIDDLYEMYNLD